jgi:hypothetical protein
VRLLPVPVGVLVSVSVRIAVSVAVAAELLSPVVAASRTSLVPPLPESLFEPPALEGLSAQSLFMAQVFTALGFSSETQAERNAKRTQAIARIGLSPPVWTAEAEWR